MDSNLINKFINKAKTEGADLSVGIDLPEQTPLAKITIEVDGQEPIVFENAEGFVVYTDLGHNRVMGLSSGSIRFLVYVIHAFQEKVAELIQRKANNQFTVVPGGRK